MIKATILVGVAMTLAACDHGSLLDSSSQEAIAVSSTASGTMMTEDQFLFRAMTVGPDYQILKVTASYELCGFKYVNLSDGELRVEYYCTDNATHGTKALPYDGGHTDLYATLDGETVFVSLAPGDLSTKVQTLQVPSGATLTLDAQAYCEFEHHDVHYDSGGYTRYFSDPITVPAGNIEMLSSMYQCHE